MNLGRGLGVFVIGFAAAMACSHAGATNGVAAQEPPKRIYTAVLLTGEPPHIDGRLDDRCWLEQGEWAGDFRQREPFEGAAPSQPTLLKILYDHRNVYVAIRAFDSDIARQPRLLAPRDDFSGDMVGVAFDSYFNKRTAFEFDVTSGGSKVDLIIRNDGTIDRTWNPIWEVKVSADEHGWTAEYRIPLSQLRYPRAKEQVWGLHSWRWLNRKQEESNWQLIPMDNRGFVHAFGELRGITELPPSRRIELLPYVLAKYDSSEKESGNPYRAKNTAKLEGGLDAKIGLASNFTLDLTVNPDFGQVEADPSEINLSTVETFLTEKRPFFTEGKTMFEYALDDDIPFYSRRIGDGPSLTPAGPGFVKMPENNPIITAEKITGRTPGGFSLGVLHALTGRTEAKIFEAGSGEHRELAEPMTNYLVARAQNDFANGDTMVGGIFTATLRRGSDRELGPLARQAITGGIDFTQYWKQRTYYLEARGLATQLEGSPQSILSIMTNLVHNYDRVDADNLRVDPNARELVGHAGRVRIGKGSNGHWRYYAGASWRSPGVDFNDLGYLATADFVQYSAQLQYYNTEPDRWLRRRDLRMRAVNLDNFGHETLQQSLILQSEFATLKNWYVSTDLRYETERLDTRMLRGGPALRRPDRVPLWMYFETDGGRSTQLRLSAGGARIFEDGSQYVEFEPTFVQRIGDRLRLDLKIGYGHNQNHTQYAATSNKADLRRYVVGHMDQKTLWSEFRVTANFSPSLSLTYFGGPYASVGRFDEFKLVTQPRAERNEDRFAKLAVMRSGDEYAARDSDGGFSFTNPDFNWRELKSNLVLRWELRAGSTLYCVWSQHRADSRTEGEFSGFDEYRSLLSAHPDNTFLVKMSYWFSL